MQDFKEQELITFKVKLGSELRRFSLPVTLQWDDLLEKINNLFNFQTGSKVTVKYEDDEKELVTVDSTEELQEAIRVYSQQQSNCIRLEIFLSQTILQPAIKVTSIPPVTECTRSVSTAGTNNTSFVPFYEQRGRHCGRGRYGKRSGSWAPMHGRHHHHQKGRWAQQSNLSDEELSQKLAEIESRGYKCKPKIIRLLRRFDGDVEQVCQVLAKQNHKDKFSAQINTLEEKGYTARGINIKLLKRFDGDMNKVMDILSKEKILQESGCSHTWMNIRLLMKHEGDVEKVKSIWEKKKEKFDKKMEKRRSKAFYKAEKKDYKRGKHDCKREWKQHQKFMKGEYED
jgi:hypothetical protein